MKQILKQIEYTIAFTEGAEILAGKCATNHHLTNVPMVHCLSYIRDGLKKIHNSIIDEMIVGENQLKIGDCGE